MYKTATITYTYGNGLISDSKKEAKGSDTEKRYYHYNHIGSTTAITDADGDLLYRIAYGTYGELTGIYDADGDPVGDKTAVIRSENLRFLYNGRYGVETGANGLYYMRARYYNPQIKRFINRDIIDGSITDSQSLNKYSYVQGNPISLVDPFGLCAQDYFSRAGHELLDWLGFIFDPADAINFLWYTAEGNAAMAAATAVAIVPAAGSFIAKGTKQAIKAGKKAAQKAGEKAAKNAAEKAAKKAAKKKLAKEAGKEAAEKGAEKAAKEAAEKAKKELSSATTTNINLPFITATQDGPKHFDMDLTRAKFDELTAHLVDKTRVPVQTALKDADLTAAELDKVLLVGGSTRIIAVQDMVKKLTGKDPFKGINPDECVAIGASIQGGKLAGDAGAGEILLLDVTPLTLSIETMGGIATHLIERNTTIPTNKSQIFSTAQDNQDAVDINIVQGEREFARDNKSLGRFRLDGIAPARRGVPQIEVTFDIDANGIVNVSAKDLGTGREQHITITSGTSLSDEDIDRAVKEAAEYEAQDKKRKEAIEVRNDADAMVFQTERALSDVGDKLSATDKTKVEADLKALKDIIESTDPDAMTDYDVEKIKAGKETLMNSAQELFSKLYEQNGPGANAGTGTGTPDYSDDVVDGDYKEV